VNSKKKNERKEGGKGVALTRVLLTVEPLRKGLMGGNLRINWRAEEEDRQSQGRRKSIEPEVERDLR